MELLWLVGILCINNRTWSEKKRNIPHFHAAVTAFIKKI